MPQSMYKARWLVSVVVLAGVAMVGCATQAELRGKQMQKQRDHTLASYRACVGRVKTSDVGLRLNEMLIVNQNDPFRGQKMAIDRHATDEEKAVLLEFRANKQPCNEQTLVGLGQVHPLLASLVTGFFSESDERALRFIQDKITIGEFNQELQESRLRHSREWGQVEAQIEQELQSAHQNETQHQQAAMEAFQRWNYQQQQLLVQQQLIRTNKPRMAITTCDYAGGNLSCVTY